MKKISRNYPYILMFAIALIVLMSSVLSEMNLIEISKLAFTSEEYRTNFFLNNETGFNGNTAFDIILHVIRTSSLQFDSTVSTGTVWFQVLIVFFAFPSGLIFFRSYYSIDKMSYYKEESFRKAILNKIIRGSIKTGLSLFLAYVIFMIIIILLGAEFSLLSESSSLLSDVFGNGLYQNYTFLYYLITGFITLFLIPFAYSVLSQSVSLLKPSIKSVVLIPLIYYFGLCAIGYALYSVIPSISLYINPSVMMASNSYFNYNSILLILINLIPLYAGLSIIFLRTKHAEI